MTNLPIDVFLKMDPHWSSGYQVLQMDGEGFGWGGGGGHQLDAIIYLQRCKYLKARGHAQVTIQPGNRQYKGIHQYIFGSHLFIF